MRFGFAVASCLIAAQVQAHFAAVEQGTLRIIDDRAYAVLSMPCDALSACDTSAVPSGDASEGGSEIGREFDSDSTGDSNDESAGGKSLDSSGLSAEVLTNCLRLMVDGQARSLEGLLVSGHASDHRHDDDDAQVTIMGVFTGLAANSALQLEASCFAARSDAGYSIFVSEGKGPRTEYRLTPSAPSVHLHLTQ